MELLTRSWVTIIIYVFVFRLSIHHNSLTNVNNPLNLLSIIIIIIIIIIVIIMVNKALKCKPSAEFDPKYFD